MTNVKLGYLILYVDHVPATLEAWKAAFGLEIHWLHEDRNYGELATGDTTISFAETEFGRAHFTDEATRASFDRKPARFEIGLTVPDVQIAFERAVASGMTPIVSPVEKPWGQVVGWVSDANGILVELGSAMEA